VIHHVFANRSNIGDWLAAKGIQRMLQPLLVTEHLCDEVFVAQTLAELSQVGPDDLVVIGGGGLFMDYFAPFWIGLGELRRRPRYCIWGVGYCDLKAEPSHPPPDVVRRVVEGSEICVVRDDLTRSYLGSDALPAPVPCPSLVEIDAAPRGWGVLHVDNYTTVGASAFEVMDAVCQRYAATTGRPYRRTNNRIEPGREADLRKCLSLYERSDVVVSSALHGCVIAVAMGRSVLAVSGDWKIEQFMDVVGLGDWVLGAAELEQLPARLQALPRQAAVPEFVEQARVENQAVARRIRTLAARSSPGGHRLA
jgi:polysaccharide pyruvyl transferase WcaK-like protein